MKIPAPIFAAALVVAGCASPQPAAVREPYVKPGLIMLTADQAERRGIVIGGAGASAQPCPGPAHALDAASVIAPSQVKAYTLSRAPDPDDAELMHEEHIAYRRESSPQWRLDSSADQKILVGPRITDGRQDMQPLLTRELTTFLVEQRRATEANQKAIAALSDAVGAIRREQDMIAEHPEDPPERTSRNTGTPGQ